MKRLELDIYEDGEHINGRYMLSAPDDVYWCDNWAELMTTLKRTISQIENMDRLKPVPKGDVVDYLMKNTWDDILQEARVDDFITEITEYTQCISNSFGVIFGGPFSEGVWVEVNVAKYINNENAPRNAYLCINGEFYQLRNS